MDNQLKRTIDELTKVLDRWPNKEPTPIDYYNMMRSTRDALLLVHEEIASAYDSFRKILDAQMAVSKNMGIIYKLGEEPTDPSENVTGDELEGQAKQQQRRGYV
jgi:hypothetical protein